MKEPLPSILTDTAIGAAPPPSGGGLLNDILPGAGAPLTRMDIFHGYIGVFVVAFLVTLLATPILRRLAIANGVVDRPTDPRKQHKAPVAYLGGVAVFLGILAGVAHSYIVRNVDGGLLLRHALKQSPVPLSVLLGMTLIMLAGLLDDVFGVRPRIKVAMQLIAAAALALNDVGVKVAGGMMAPLGSWLFNNERLLFHVDVGVPAWLQEALPALGSQVGIPIDVVYWVGTAIIAVFILGACNASNLIDGLDGLCSGVTAIAAVGLLFLSLTLATLNDGPLDFARIVLCLALLGGCLGFLPHNFNPATIFLGDAGSLLLGFMSIVIILSLGDTGNTGLVIAGLLVYLLPIIDTTLAIVRRKLAGKPMSAADDQHLHHQLKRALGVKGAVFVLYGMAAVFAALGGVISGGRARVAYAVALVIASFIGVTAVKIARRKALEEEALSLAGVGAPASARSTTRAPRPAEPPRSPASPEPAGAKGV